MSAEYTRDEWTSMIGEGLHTGFRKGSDHPRSSEYWNIISNMPTDLWGDALNYCVDGLASMKVIEVKEETS